MLIVAACDDGGDNADSDSSTENGTEETSENGDNGETEEAATEEESTEEESDEGETEEGTEESATEESSGDESDENGDGEDVAESGNGDEAQPDDEATAEPGAEGTPSQPGPQEGMFPDLTVEEANEMTDFEVKEPQEIPEGVEFQSIMGMASQEASEEERSEEAATIIFSYTQPSEEEGAQPLPIEITQSSELDLSASLPPDTEQEEVTIGDREVTRVNVTDQSGNDVLAYMWNEDDIHYSLAAIMGPDLEESELENMLASIPAS